MKIVRKQVVIKNYSEVEIGEVFATVDDGTVYMETDQGAVSLEDGYNYSIDRDDKVQILEVELHVGQSAKAFFFCVWNVFKILL